MTYDDVTNVDSIGIITKQKVEYQSQTLSSTERRPTQRLQSLLLIHLQ